MINGLLIFDKPPGITSHEAVEKLKISLNANKAGHTGTLDPFATGVLPVCFNKATKLIQFLDENTKEYDAGITLGVITDTYDYTGSTISKRKVGELKRIEIEKIIDSFKGKVKQVPPMFSAIKVDGKKLYDLARKGIEVERKPREIVIHDIKLVDFHLPIIEIRVKCSKGTYIRSLASDIGDAIGCGAHLSSLKRIASGRFNIEDSYSLEEIESGSFQVLSVKEMLNIYQSVDVDLDIATMIKNGRQLTKNCLQKVLLPNFNKMDIITTLFDGEVVSLSQAKIDSSQFEYAEDKDIIFQHLRVLN